MWTVKRILILLLSLLSALSSFTVYALILGIIDGVQPLPLDYLPQIGELPPPPDPISDVKLKVGFGPACKELQRPLRLWLPDRGIVFAAGAFEIEKSGKVHLSPFSAAFYHKSKKPGAFPEISTIRCDIAILTLDRPVSQFSELSNRKVIAVEMVGKQPNNITLTNNRGTEQKNDDIDILITNGNLFYEERRDLIWTDGVVCLTDHQSKPPMVISGRGLDMQLVKEAGPDRPRPRAAAEKHSETGNIKSIAMRSDVDMKFWADARSGFLGGNANANTPPKSAAAPRKGPPEKELIHIHTGGPFFYDLTREIAWFESPPPRENKLAKDPFAPDQVHVHRVQKLNGGEKFDQLTCDRLDLVFRRRINPGNAGPAGEGGDKEIETARATRRDINQVILALDSEGMDACGDEMIYIAGDAVKGPQTTLKGEPLRSAKDGHQMRSKELHLFGANQFGEGQRAWAKGPGQIDLLDPKNPKKDTYPTHVIWRDFLTVVKEKEGGKVYDVMTVTGEASYIDDLQKQELHGERITVHTEQLQEAAQKPDAVGGARTELRRVFAQERVRAFSPEFIVRKAKFLTMTFHPEVARDAMLPTAVETKPAPPPPGPGPGPMPEKGVETKPPVQTKPPVETKPPVQTKPLVEIKPPVEEPKKPKAPIEIEANEITVAIATLGGQRQLQDLVAKGNVYVFQPSEKQGQKALDIVGTLLTVKHYEKGDTLVVYGDKDKPARVEVEDTIIVGPRVTVNQADNRADVDGNGYMEMPSNKNVDGSDATKKDARITVQWNKNMTFDGMYAVYYGGVQVHENGAYSRGLCQVLTAKLDKHVSFKEGQKDKQNAKLDRLVFDRNVFIEDYKFDEKKQPLQYNKLLGQVLINREEGPTNVTGPGWVRLLAKGAADQGLAPQPASVVAKPAPAKLEWKLTHIKFSESMDSNTKNNLKKTTFYGLNGGVEVCHFPTIDIDANMDPDRPPENGLYLRSDTLVVEGKQTADRTTQIMIAERNVTFRTDKYLGYADIVKYDEANDLVIFEATNGNKVRMYEVGPSNMGKSNPVSLNSTKVLYNRKTGKIDTEGVRSIRTN